MSATAGPLPTFLLVGAMKSGTTTLIRTLGAHPDVYAPDQEVRFFDRHYDRGLDWYRGEFAAAGDARAVGESTPAYLYQPHAVPRMAATLPDATLVAILREPVARAYSHYWHNRTRGHEELSFEEALDAEPERLAARGPLRRPRYAYVGHGRYVEQIERLTQHYPRSAVEVVLFEDLRRDPNAVLARLFSVLGVDPAKAPERVEAQNRYLEFRSMRMRGPIRRLPMPLRRVAARLNVRYTTYPPLEPDARARVQARFEDANRELAAWLGRDLSEWRR
jgi:hypothetical protein